MKYCILFTIILIFSFTGNSFSTETLTYLTLKNNNDTSYHFLHKKRKSKKQQLHELSVKTDSSKNNFSDMSKKNFFPSNYIKDVYNQLDTAQYSWADSVFNALTPTQRIAQLFMVPAYSNKGKEHKEQIAKLITDYTIGGIIFFQGGPVRQANLTNYYQSIAKVPLMISIDAEWGLPMRLDSTFKFPRQMMLGAINNDTLIYLMGSEIAKHCRRIGTHINFAPDIDINNNPLNPVISSRSFGENKFKVAKKGLMYMRGMQDQRVLTTGKHFPGHGDTDSDSHLTLPTIKHSKQRLDTLELYPFKYLFNNGLLGAMVAHLYIPNLDSTPNLASTLSKRVVKELLINELNYKGLIFTDALNMKGVSKYYEPGVVDLQALLAGNDVLLNAEDVPKAIEQIEEAIYQGIISRQEVEAHCLKILRYKEWLGLNNYKPVSTQNIYQDINNSYSEYINRLIIEDAQTVLINKDNILPIKSSNGYRIATILVNTQQNSAFQNTISIYTPSDFYYLPKNMQLNQLDSLLANLVNYDLIITGVFNIQSKPESNFGMPSYLSYLIDTIAKIKPTVLSMFGNAYAIGKLKSVDNLKALVLSYEDNTNTQVVNAHVLFGAIGANGRLPVSIPPFFKEGDCITTTPINVVQTVLPIQIGITDSVLREVDKVIELGIKENAYPGCQVYAAKNGKIFLNKSYGKYTYTGDKKVTNNAVYDLASVTKIASSALAIMKLKDDGLINLNDSLGKHLPQLKNTALSNILISELLTHQSGLPSWIPFYQSTIKNDSIRNYYYKDIPTDTFTIRVAQDMYIRSEFIDSIYHQIYTVSLSEKKYNYSDLGYYLIKQIIEKYTKTTLDSFVTNSFYKPMGLWTMRYKPRTWFNLEQIVPTEEDKAFRKQLLCGDVHDQGAALLGGVGGHAGLFSNAEHLGVLMQMLLNKGNYGGVQYLSPQTVEEFISCPFCNTGNRRGYCFDKQEPNPGKDSPTAKSASLQSFGHSGFTGTYAWADPESGLVFVFLSNRVHPSANNKKITQLSIRTNVHEILNRAVLQSNKLPITLNK
jgi:beta-glucosidase-like glycosyl hydrolase/CubicO group peptidase (beta-lactamase class C family)